MTAARLGIVLSATAFLSGCGITAIRPYASAAGSFRASSELGSVTVRVVGERKSEVQRATEMLRKSGVFKAVTSDPQQPVDMTATVLDSRDGIKCGTPQMLTYFTLGLIPTGNAYRARLQLSFSGAESVPPVRVEPELFAQTKHGFWALPLRASRNWMKPRWDDDPANLSGLLRDEILAHESELLALVRRNAA